MVIILATMSRAKNCCKVYLRPLLLQEISVIYGTFNMHEEGELKESEKGIEI